jgi:hypothetical protein
MMNTQCVSCKVGTQLLNIIWKKKRASKRLIIKLGDSTSSFLVMWLESIAQALANFRSKLMYWASPWYFPDFLSLSFRTSKVKRAWGHILNFLSNLKGHNVGITDWRDLWCTPLRWPHVPWYTHQVSCGLVPTLESCFGRYTYTHKDTQTKRWSRKTAFIFQNKESKLKINSAWVFNF